MLILNVPGSEEFDESTSKFIVHDPTVLELEHSLVSLSKWESIYQKPFLGPDKKTPEEVHGYIRAMLLSPEPPEDFLQRLSRSNHDQINDYIGSVQSATTFGLSQQSGKRGRPEIITSELIYYWLVAFQIPFEVENWHLNRLFALLQICNIKQSKPKKMSRREIAAQNRQLNAERKARLGTSG